MIKVPGSQDDYAVILTSDYINAIKQQSTTNSTRNSSSSHRPSDIISANNSAAFSPNRCREVFQWFCDRVLPQCKDVVITHDHLVKLLSETPLTRYSVCLSFIRYTISFYFNSQLFIFCECVSQCTLIISARATNYTL